MNEATGDTFSEPLKIAFELSLLIKPGLLSSNEESI